VVEGVGVGWAVVVTTQSLSKVTDKPKLFAKTLAGQALARLKSIWKVIWLPALIYRPEEGVVLPRSQVVSEEVVLTSGVSEVIEPEPKRMRLTVCVASTKWYQSQSKSRSVM